jgi:hypothetical protein
MDESYNYEHKDNDFYSQAAKKIYDWLPEEKKDKLGSELSSEGLSSLYELESKERFLRLINFLDLNYLKPIEWAEKSIEIFKTLVTSQQLDLRGEVREPRIEIQPQISLFQILKSADKSGMQTAFSSALEKADVSFEYSNYYPKKERSKET